MKAHILLAHPEPNSFNGRLLGISKEALAAAGYDCSVSDLYAMDFDPREGQQHYPSRKDPDSFHTQTEQRFSADNGTIPADVASEVRHLEEADLLVVHFPLWWFGAPAILKGWMDRVFVYGRLYRSEMRYDAGICAGKRMIACVTTGANEDNCAFNGREGDTKLILWPILFPFRYLGYTVLEPQIFHGVGGVAFMEGQEGGRSTLDIYSDEWTATISDLQARPSIAYNADSDFDDTKRLKPDAPVYAPFIRQNSDWHKG